MTVDQYTVAILIDITIPILNEDEAFYGVSYLVRWYRRSERICCAIEASIQISTKFNM